MSVGNIYGKTALGLDEVGKRKLKLAPRLRTMLILIDGHQPALVLQDEAAKLGAPVDFIEQLIALRLVEKVDGVAGARSKAAVHPGSLLGDGESEYLRFRAAKDFMNITVVDALGIRAFFFTLKLERAGNVADLRELVEGYRDAINKGSGPEQAKVFAERLNTMLR